MRPLARLNRCNQIVRNHSRVGRQAWPRNDKIGAVRLARCGQILSAFWFIHCLLTAGPSELPVLRDALSPYGSTLSPRLWALLDSARPGESRLLPVAGALATYAPDEARWADLGAKVSRALVAVNPVFLGSWLDVLRPVRSKLDISARDDLRR